MTTETVRQWEITGHCVRCGNPIYVPYKGDDLVHIAHWVEFEGEPFSLRTCECFLGNPWGSDTCAKA